MGVIAALEAQGFEPGDDVEIGGVVFELDPVASSRAAMPVAVVKLGSSIVADDARRAARCPCVARDLRGGRRAAPRRASTSCRHLGRDRARDAPAGAAGAPARRSRSCRRRARSARAGSTAPTTSCCASAAIQTAQVLLTFFDMSARTHYLNARRTLRKLLDWRIVPVINENDTTTTDEISLRRQRLPRRAGRGAASAPTCCVLLTDTDGLYTADPRVDPARELVDEVADSERARGAARSATRARRSARAGCARRSSRPRWRPRPGIPTVIGSGLEPGRAARARGRASAVGHALRAAGRAPLELQAVAASTPSPRHGTRDGRRGRRAGAARGRHEPAAGRDRRRRGRVRRRRRGRGRARPARPRSARGSATTRRPSCAA